MTLAWWLGFMAVMVLCVMAWRSEDWWAMATYKCGKRAGTLARRRVQREDDRRRAALAGEHFIAEVRHQWDGIR